MSEEENQVELEKTDQIESNVETTEETPEVESNIETTTEVISDPTNEPEQSPSEQPAEPMQTEQAVEGNAPEELKEESEELSRAPESTEQEGEHDPEAMLVDKLTNFVPFEEKGDGDTEPVSNPAPEGVAEASDPTPSAPDNSDTDKVTAKLLNSPKPPKNHDFVNVDYNADHDDFKLEVGLTLSRNGSNNSIPVEPKELLFTKIDTEFELPRAETPTKEEGEQVPVAPVAEHTEPEQLQEEENIEQPQQEETVEPEPQIDRNEVIQLICKELEAKEKLTTKNISLQNRLADHFKRKRLTLTDDSKDNEKNVTDQDQRYYTAMNSLRDLREEYETMNISNKKGLEEYQARLSEKMQEVTEKAEQFWKYKRAIALQAENSRTGKNLPEKVVEQLETTERKKESEVIAVQLENIKLRNKLRRHEQLLRQKEELADGLHLIDFEQLKIENQTYNEKIEERNEELLKLRRKITNVVQVLTHVKEKLQFVQSETADLKAELSGLDAQVELRRDSLPILKNSRDKLRSNNTLLRQQNGLLGNERLLVDYGNNVDEAKKIRDKIASLQQTYQNLISESADIRKKIQKSQLIAHMQHPSDSNTVKT